MKATAPFALRPLLAVVSVALFCLGMVGISTDVARADQILIQSGKDILAPGTNVVTITEATGGNIVVSNPGNAAPLPPQCVPAGGSDTWVCVGVGARELADGTDTVSSFEIRGGDPSRVCGRAGQT